MVISCEFREVSKNTISYRTPPMATPGPKKVQWKCVLLKLVVICTLINVK